MRFPNSVTAAFLLLSSVPSNLIVDSFSATVRKTETPFSFLNRVVDNTAFNVVEEPSKRGATVLEAPVNQDGVKLYIAIDSDSFCNVDRPGNGGIRLLHYDTTEDAVDDAVRLAKGMTRKHDMFRTGFSGAKVVVNVDSSKCLTKVKRECLMKDTADALHSLEGTMYTGCDLNTSDEDMDYLTEATKNKYVLAGRDSNVDTNIATASSVIGSILGTVEAMEGSLDKMKDLTFTVQGCGKVGGTVARELVRLGAKKVYTCDLFSDLAKIDGCIPVDDWTKQTCDFLVPCANSLSITEEVATNFPEGIMYCVGAANSPFASSEAKSIFDNRGILHIPESISSAGAILADSVEWFDMDLYQTVKPELMYGWIRDISKKKSASLVRHSNLDSNSVDSNLGNVIPSRDGDPVGKEFPEWIKENTKETNTLIVGGGLAGTATAFAMSERGFTSILAEQGESLAPPSASSNGDSRMYRKMYSNEFFSKMQSKALDRWNDVERITGEELLQQNGLLFYGEDTGETVEGSVLGAKEVMEKLNLPHTFYATGDEIASAYPALAGCKGKPYSGVKEDTAGHIRATKACKAMVDAAGDKCNLLLKTKITSIDTERDDCKIVATTEEGQTIIADNAVIACGPWTNRILEASNMQPLDLFVWQVQWAHYEVSQEIASSIPQAFHFRKESNIDGGLYYVFPASATETLDENLMSEGKSYVKVGVDFPTGGDLNGMENFSYKGSDEVLALIDGWVQEHLPEVGKRIDSYCSPYTMTKDSYFVMDKVAPNVAIFGGGSGRAFKFGPLLGDCIASLLTDEESPVDMAPFSAKRDAVSL